MRKGALEVMLHALRAASRNHIERPSLAHAIRQVAARLPATAIPPGR